MAVKIPIQAIPNQSLVITLDGFLFEISIKTTNGATVFSTRIDGVDVIMNTRCVAGSAIIPARYMERGNFMFITQDYKLPVYSQFNTTQYLAYFTNAELAAMRVKNTGVLDYSFFNPIAEFSLRYKPEGYSEVI
jgi:hypothetical protein